MFDIINIYPSDMIYNIIIKKFTSLGVDRHCIVISKN